MKIVVRAEVVMRVQVSVRSCCEGFNSVSRKRGSYYERGSCFERGSYHEIVVMRVKVVLKTR